MFNFAHPMSIAINKISEIEAKAATILQNIYPNDIDIPVDLSKILETNGITLKIGDFDDNDIAGAFDRESKTIFISKNSPYQRNAFTIAHELGHYFLHQDKSNEIFYRLSADLINTQEDNTQEQEANWFAASLLMPKESLLKYSEIFKNDVDMLAKIFGVSKTAMYFRLKNLNLINGKPW